MKTKVICDTNIWYNIGEGLLSVSEFNAFELIATFYNFEELITTPKTVKDFPKVKRAAEAITVYSHSQILENAFLYLARLIDPNHVDTKYSYNLGIRNWGEVRAMAKLPEDFQITDAILSAYQQNITNKTNECEELAQIENKLAKQYKKEAKNLWRTNKSGYYKANMQAIVGILNAGLQQLNGPKLTELFEIKQIELFITAHAAYFKNMEIGTMVAQPNDMYDLYNMIYVKPGMKYLTFENRWKDILRQADLSHYLLREK
jgi:hypothetical protein